MTPTAETEGHPPTRDEIVAMLVEALTKRGFAHAWAPNVAELVVATLKPWLSLNEQVKAMTQNTEKVGHHTQIESKVVTRYEVWCGCGWHKEFSDHRDAQDARLDHEAHASPNDRSDP